MVLITFKSDNPANKLVSSVAELYGKPGKYCDVNVQIENTIFKCHKLILALHSTYFEQLFFSATAVQTIIINITLNDMLPVDFQNVLRYLYTGEVELDNNTVGRILQVAELTHLDHLKRVCLQFMKDALSVETSVKYWKGAEHVNDSSLRSSCLDIVAKEFVRVTKLTRLQYMTQDMMKAILERDDLNIDSELDVCEVLMSWLTANNGSDQSINPVQLLSLIRWSGVNIEYIKSTINNYELLIKDRACFEYLSGVIKYCLSGVQFPCLRTHHRPSTGLESSVVIFGVATGLTITRECYRVSLQNTKRVAAIAEVPTDMEKEATACANNSSVFVSGIGTNTNETWRWDSTGGWTRCADMSQGRRRHCATFVNDTSMYVLGGWVDSTETTLLSVERYNTMTNKWTTVGQLAQCAESVACVTYKTSIYLFGGCHLDKSTNDLVGLDCIQEYDTTTQKCTVITQRLPQPRDILRAVLWDKSVLLMNGRTCLIFDLEQKTIQQRDKFAPGVDHFGLILDNQTLFVLGGWTDQTDSNGEDTWTCTDEVKSIPVMDIIKKQKKANWTQHAKLESSSLVHAYALVTIPCTYSA